MNEHNAASERNASAATQWGERSWSGSARGRLALAILLALAGAGCDSEPSAAPTAASAPPPSSVKAAPKAAASSSATGGSTSATSATIKVPPGGRVDEKVNATFYHYQTSDLEALSQAQRKLLADDGYTIDKDTKATGYHILEVSKAGKQTKVSVACTPEKKECFVSISK